MRWIGKDGATNSRLWRATTDDSRTHMAINHHLLVWVALATASMIELIVFPDDGSFTRHGGSYHQNDRAREHRAGRPS